MSALESAFKRRRLSAITPPYNDEDGETSDLLNKIVSTLNRNPGLTPRPSPVPVNEDEGLKPQAGTQALSVPTTPPFVERQRLRLVTPNTDEPAPSGSLAEKYMRQAVPDEPDQPDTAVKPVRRRDPISVDADSDVVVRAEFPRGPEKMRESLGTSPLTVEPLRHRNVIQSNGEPADLGGGSTYSGQAEDGLALDTRTRPRWFDKLNKYQSRRDADEENPPKMSKKRAALISLFGAMATYGGKPVDPALLSFSPDAISKYQQRQLLAEDDQRIAGELGRRKAVGDLNAQQANTEWVRQRPVLEESKEARRAKYDAWRMSSGDRKLDTADKYIQWRMSNGDRRATTAEGQLELRQEWQEFNKDATTRRLDQGDTRITETARHNEAVERALGDYRGEVLKLRAETNQISRERGTGRGTKPTVDRAALNRARSVADNFQRYKSLAVTAPETSTDPKVKTRADYLNAARMEADVLRSNYPDLFEVGEGEGGWPYVKPKGGGASKMASMSDVQDYAKQHGISAEDARRKFEAEGWSVR